MYVKDTHDTHGLMSMLFVYSYILLLSSILLSLRKTSSSAIFGQAFWMVFRELEIDIDRDDVFPPYCMCVVVFALVLGL